jgi:hypothetical protein
MIPSPFSRAVDRGDPVAACDGPPDTPRAAAAGDVEALPGRRGSAALPRDEAVASFEGCPGAACAACVRLEEQRALDEYEASGKRPVVP